MHPDGPGRSSCRHREERSHHRWSAPASPRTPCASRAWTSGHAAACHRHGRRHPACHRDHRGRHRDGRRSHRHHRGDHRSRHHRRRHDRVHQDDPVPHPAHRDARPGGRPPSGRASCPGSDEDHRGADQPHPERPCGDRERHDRPADAACPGWLRRGCCRDGVPHRERHHHAARAEGDPCPGSRRTDCCPDGAGPGESPDAAPEHQPDHPRASAPPGWPPQREQPGPEPTASPVRGQPDGLGRDSGRTAQQRVQVPKHSVPRRPAPPGLALRVRPVPGKPTWPRLAWQEQP